ncbi:hypothetical protein [uncultured Paracoccus sp.]|uniref:hypothetical protein n=1 Tax=uncultured Paracoccus sp. TaxID=189685 RepID=UPI0025CE9BAA|nr:hypothetical protein [uncultured Paracoccus sp.]
MVDLLVVHNLIPGTIMTSSLYDRHATGFFPITMPMTTERPNHRLPHRSAISAIQLSVKGGHMAVPMVCFVFHNTLKVIH